MIASIDHFDLVHNVVVQINLENLFRSSEEEHNGDE